MLKLIQKLRLTKNTKIMKLDVISPLERKLGTPRIPLSCWLKQHKAMICWQFAAICRKKRANWEENTYMVQVQMSNLSLQPEICLRVPIKLAVTSDETFPVYSPLTLMTATLLANTSLWAEWWRMHECLKYSFFINWLIFVTRMVQLGSEALVRYSV